MTKYWLLSYPRGNIEISVNRKLIGGKSTKAYERLFKDDLSSGDKLAMLVTGEGKVRGFCSIASDYIYDETPVWPVVNGETYPHRRSIEPIKLFNLTEEPSISDFYQELDLLEAARAKGVNLGMSFGMRKRGLTPMEITEHDFNLLFSSQGAEDIKEVTPSESQILKVIEKFKKQGKKSLPKKEFLEELARAIQQEKGLKLKEGWESIVWQKLKELAQETIEE